MAEKLQLGIVISADGKAAEGALGRVRASITQLGATTRRTGEEIEKLHAGWARLGQQHRAKMAAAEWTERLSRAARQASVDVDALAQSAERSVGHIGRRFQDSETATRAFASAARIAQAAFGGFAAALTTRAVFDTIAEFDRLNASLKTVTGSVSGASNAMVMLKQFSAETPYDLQEVTEAFIRLRSLGLDATRKSLTSFGNTASAMGKPIMQFVEAVADATTGEFERLKEFGIKASKAGDQVAFTFQGVTTAVQNNATEIQRYLLDLGNTTFAGGMADQMNTVGGELSSLREAFGNLVDDLGNLGVRDALMRGFAGAAEFIGEIRAQVDSIAGSSREGLTAALERRIAEQKSVVKGMKHGFLGSGLFVDTDGIDQRNREIESMEAALARLKREAKAAAQSLDAVGKVTTPSKSVDLDSLTRQQRGYVEAFLKSQEIAQKVAETAKQVGVDPAWAVTIAAIESHFDQAAVSAKGALGVMQLMPGTAEAMARQVGDSSNRAKELGQNLLYGVTYLKEMSKYAKDSGDILSPSAAYNAGPGNFLSGKWTQLDETRNYVKLVESLYPTFAQLLGQQNQMQDAAKAWASAEEKAFGIYRANQEAAISAAEDMARQRVEAIKTSLAGIEAEKKAMQEAAKQQIAAATTYDEKQKILAAAAAQSDEFARRSLELVKQEIAAQEEAARTRQDSLRQELAHAEAVGADYEKQIQLKQAIASVDTDLAALAEARARAEIEAGAKVNEMALQAAELRQKEANLIRDTSVEYERQSAILERLKQAQADGAGPEQLKQMADVLSAIGELPEFVSQDQLDRLQALNQHLAQTRDEIKKLTGTDQDVREAQLRMNAFWDQYMGRLRDYASTWEEITGQTEDGFGRMMVAMGEYAKQIDQIGAGYDEMRKRFGQSDVLDMAEGFSQAQAALNAMAQTMLAMRSNYAEGTKGYNDMTAAAERMMEVQRVLQVVEGVLAVIHQLSSGDVYTAIPRALGVAAMIASLGVDTGASGGAGGMGGSGYVDQSGVNGGVFGDAEAQGDILAALEVIRDNSSNDLNYSAAMLVALRNIESGLAGVSNSLINTIYPSAMPPLGFNGSPSSMMGALGRISDPLGKMGASIFQSIDKFTDPLTKALQRVMFSVRQKITGYGIQSWAQSLDQIIAKGLGAASFTEIEKTTKVIGITVGKSVKNIYDWSGANEAARQFTQVIKGIADAIKAGGEAFGMAGSEVMKKIGKVQIDLGRIDLKGLSGKEIQEKLSAEFDRIASQLAKKAMPRLGPFQQIGESYFKTYVRVAEGINRATGELERLGLAAVDFRAIRNRQGDVAAEIVRDTLMTQSRLSDGVRAYVDALDGSAEDIIGAYRKLQRASALLAVSGAPDGAANLDRTMINAAGGLDAFVAAMESFTEDFLGASAALAGQMAPLADGFARLGYVVPDSKEAFIQLVQGIDTSTESGKRLFGALIQLSEGFASVQKTLQSIKDKYKDVFGGNDFTARIREVQGDFAVLITDVDERLRTANDWPKIFENSLNRLTEDMSKAWPKLFNARAAAASIRDRITGKEGTLHELEARQARTYSAERARRIEKIRNEIEQLRAQLDDANKVVEAFQHEVDGIDRQIADLIGKGLDNSDEVAALIEERRQLIEKQGAVLLGAIGEAWESFLDQIEAGKNLQADILDQIGTLTGELGGKRGIADAAGAKAQAAFDAALAYSGDNAQVQINLIQKAKDAIMDRYQKELDAINENKAALEAQQAEAEKLQAELDQTISSMTAALDSLASLGQTLASDLVSLGAEGFSSTEWANRKLDMARTDMAAYDAAVAGGTPRDVEREVELENDLRQAIMDRYQSEVDAINRANEAQIKALEEQLQAAQALHDAVERVREYAQSLRLGDRSTLSPERKLAEAQRQYAERLAKAQGGDAQAMQALTGAADAYLDAARNYYGSSGAYTSVFDAVSHAMDGIGAMDVADPDSIQARIDDLRDPEKNAAIKALREQAVAELKALQERMEATRQLASEQLEDARGKAEENLRKLDEIKAQIAAIDNNPAIEALKQRTIEELQALNERLGPSIEALEQDGREKMQTMIDALVASNILNQDQLATLREMARSMGLNAPDPAAGNPGEGVPAHAAGGHAQRGLALVGEQGPELVRFERPAQILNAEDTRKALSGGNNAELKAALADFRREMQALVTVQSRANPDIIAGLRGLGAQLEEIERTVRLKS